MDLESVIDLHVHCSPDVRPRLLTSVQLTTAAKKAGMRALVLNNTLAPTVAVAEVLREVIPGIEVFGGLALNGAAGGLNLEAVATALRMGAAQIWMPTSSAEQDRAYHGRPLTGITILDEEGGLRSEVREILRLIAGADVILGTGHLSPYETSVLVREARENGLTKILITHPEIDCVRLPVRMQKELSGPGVYFERCFARKGFLLDWDGLARSIQETGVENNVLATDLGQPENPDPIEGLRIMRREMRARGFSDSELRSMMCETPAQLLKLV